MYNLIHLSARERGSKEVFWGVSNALGKEGKASSALFQKQMKSDLCFDYLYDLLCLHVPQVV